MSDRRFVSPTLLACVVVIATSGIVYELVAGTLASYVLGDSVAQFSFVIGLYLFAMGIGSYLSKFIEHALLERFVEIELALAIVGGFSAPILFLMYTASGAFRATLYLVVLVIGALVGVEIPLLIRLLQFRLDLKELVARVLALDYVGALFASLLFPLLLVPRLGLQRTSMAFGILNALVALASTFLLPTAHEKKWRLRFSCAVTVAALSLGMVMFERFALRGEATFLGAPIAYATQSHYQRIVLTRSPRTTRLFLNGNLQFSSDDEHRYHEVLVHPAVAALGREPKSVLILGGGDGLGAREVLRYPNVERIVLVDLDPEVTKIFREVPVARELNRDSLHDARVTIKNEDAFGFLETCTDSFDLAVVDFPDPGNYAVGKLYTLSFYERLRERVGPRGVAIVQATSPYFARESFWTIAATIEAAGFRTLPLHVHVPSFGEWGFVLAGGEGMGAPRALALPRETLRFLSDDGLPGLFLFPRDMAPMPASVNRLNDQKLVSIYTSEWADWQR